MNYLSNTARIAAAERMPEAQAGTVPTYVIVTQVKSNRIVYFTDDPHYQPPMEGDWYYCSSCQGPLPPELTLRNCWGWRFNGGVFADARESPRKSAAETLVENNRKALLRILREKIDLVREPVLPACAAGETVRSAKLGEARDYLVSPEKRASYPLVQAVAVARNISVIQAANLIAAKAEATDQVLFETERFREQFSQAIQQANGEAQLRELREWLLDKVYPELTRQFHYRLENTEPPDLGAPLGDTHRLHEVTRLKVQLREAINEKREPLHSEYLGNEEMRRHKVALAQSLLENAGNRREGFDYGLLEAYADARGLTLAEAAQLVVNSHAASRELLLGTERIKDQLLARIDAIRSLADIEAVGKMLAELQ